MLFFRGVTISVYSRSPKMDDPISFYSFSVSITLKQIKTKLKLKSK